MWNQTRVYAHYCNVVSQEEYNQWLERAKVEVAKEEINNSIKIAKQIKEIN